MKIAYIVESMYNSGGMERVISQKANWLSKQNGIEVSIITYNNKTKPYYFELNESINKINIELKDYNKVPGHSIRKNIKQKLNTLLNEQKFDICISTFGQEFFILNQIKDGSKKIVEFHFSFEVNRCWQKNSSFLNKIMGMLKQIRMIYYGKKFSKIVVLTKSDLSKWERYTKKVVQIYNPITFETKNNSTCENPQVIAVGRLDYQKGFDYLIKAWKYVDEVYPNWKLSIYGGGEKRVYENLISNFSLKNKVLLRGVSPDIISNYLDSSIFVLSSRYEGFPLVILEAMQCGLPIISFDCPTGPKELITNFENGFLVNKVGDIKSLADSIIKLIEDKVLRKEMGSKAKLTSMRFKEYNIMNQWMVLFNELIFN